MGACMSVYPNKQFCSALRDRPAKTLARWAGVHPGTAERWQRGETEPRASELVRLMAADASIFAEIAALAGRADAGQRVVAAEHLKRALAALGEG